MSYEVAVLPEHQLGVVRLLGTVTGDTIVQALQTLYTSEAWKPGYDAVWDSRERGELAVSTTGVDNILDQVRRLKDHAGSGRVALVVRDESEYWLVQMLLLKSDTDDRERKAFYLLDEALQWLDVSNVLRKEPEHELHAASTRIVSS